MFSRIERYRPLKIEISAESAFFSDLKTAISFDLKTQKMALPSPFNAFRKASKTFCVH